MRERATAKVPTAAKCVGLAAHALLAVPMNAAQRFGTQVAKSAADHDGQKEDVCGGWIKQKWAQTKGFCRDEQCTLDGRRPGAQGRPSQG
ncbi:MAG TPA: hypothetical protein VFK05_32830 [Polyangiaceae bacterium]|nr:hypothetical protein [Polyangiaceae bacterium]